MWEGVPLIIIPNNFLRTSNENVYNESIINA